jgi:hypothetical protein
VGRSGVAACNLSWEELPDRNFRIILTVPDGVVSVIGSDLFQGLQELRLLLEPRGLSVAVQGGRKNAWASGMQRNMTGAQKVYLCHEGRHMSKENLVNIFDDADPSELATVAEQNENYRLWRESLPGVRPA